MHTPLTLLVVVLAAVLGVLVSQVHGFHLPFGHRLFKSAQNPQLNPASSLIRPIECRNSNNHSEVGICMFSIDCMQNKGVPLSVCKHNYFVGTCCKLPDYNNFVGIVYDLRDTEANQLLLEARKAAAAPLDAAAPKQQVAVANSSPATVAASSSTAAPSTHQTPPQPTSQALQATATSATTSDSPPPTPSTAATSTTGKLEERYVISSASLFAPTSGQNVEQRAASSSSSVAPVGESARNVEGQSASALVAAAAGNQNPLVSKHGQIELDSFQIQTSASPPNQSTTTTTTSTSTTTTQRVPMVGQERYELIRDDAEVLGSVSSAHGSSSQIAPISQQQQAPNVIEPARQQPVAETPATEIRLPQAAGGIYLVEEQQQQQQQQQNIVFANNHSQQSPSTRPPASSTSSTATIAHRSGAPTVVMTTTAAPTSAAASSSSDQEFTLSSATQQASSPSTQALPTTLKMELEVPTSSSPATATTGGLQGSSQGDTFTTQAFSSSSSSSVSQTTQPAITTTLGQQASSSHVDLISQTAGAETTTPFTTSLSTALLPNISSHPYAPTEAPAAAASSPSSQLVVQHPSSSSPSAHAHHQQPHRVTPQLYAGQQTAAPSTAATSHDHHRPLLLLGGNGGAWPPSAAKIVTGASHSAQNLIPGLGGLQSTLLSQFPFKLASGLSSGLSNYLQAAMKPSSSSSAPSRPLISSNNQPASQFQQQQQQQVVANANASAKPAAAIKFPTTIEPPVASSSPPVAAAAASSPSAVGGFGWQLGQFGQQANGTLQSPPSLHDPAQLVCGRPQVMPLEQAKTKRVARIVGGNQSMFGQWPWMVSLRQWRKGAFLHKCGAALLNEKWAITAAHCVENVKASDLLLRLGEFDVSNQEEPYPYVERRVKTVVSHPSFDPKTFEYDLALLKFAEPIKYERNVVPVCVPSGNDSYVDRMATVIGWGRLYEDGPLPDVIQHVDVPIITNNECEKMYKNAGYIEEIPDMFICAGISKGGRDSCEGDSGGPLTMVDHDGRSYLVGIISWGIGCALPSQPGVYTRITAFSGWINQITAF